MRLARSGWSMFDFLSWSWCASFIHEIGLADSGCTPSEAAACSIGFRSSYVRAVDARGSICDALDMTVMPNDAPIAVDCEFDFGCARGRIDILGT